MVDIKGSLSDDSYTWAEDRPGGGGGGPRSMKIMGPGLPTGGILWGVDPNPHGNSTYNDNGQAGLYAGFVKKIDTSWPTKGKATWTTIDDVTDVKDKKVKADLLKKGKPQQVAALKKMNTEAKEAAEKLVADNYVKAVIKHLAGKKGSTFTYGGVLYTLG